MPAITCESGIYDCAGVCDGGAVEDCNNVCGGGAVTLWGDCYDVEGTTTLDLTNNQLTGVIPSEICNQGDSTPEVNYNNLCPPYPDCIGQSDINSQDTSNCDD